MTGNSNFVSGSVKLITCQTCGSKIPLFDFETETDVDGVGLCSAARCDQMDIVIAETTFDEWKSITTGGLRQLPRRLALEVGATDHHVLHIKRIDQEPPPAAGGSFSEFKKGYKRPSVIYDCPCCDGGEGVETDELTVSEFENLGGHIFPLGKLVLRK